MTWMDLIIGGLSTAYLTNYCDLRWRTQIRDVPESYRRKTTGPSGPLLEFLVRATVQVQRWLSLSHWAALNILSILTLADYLPAGLAYGLKLPIYALSAASVSTRVCRAGWMLRPSVSLVNHHRIRGT
jgi:hypothetical protein